MVKYGTVKALDALHLTHFLFAPCQRTNAIFNSQLIYVRVEVSCVLPNTSHAVSEKPCLNGLFLNLILYVMTPPNIKQVTKSSMYSKIMCKRINKKQT